MKSLSSVGPSVHPSLNFLKIESLVFSDIVHDDSWPWYLVTDGARFSKKNFGGFFIFSGSLVFFETAYIDSMQQCQHLVEVKFTKKSFGAQIWAKGAKIGLETSFLPLCNNNV